MHQSRLQLPDTNQTTEGCRETTRRSLSCAHVRKKGVYERGEKIDFNGEIPRTRSYSRDDHRRNKVDLGRCFNDNSYNNKPVKWSRATSKNNSNSNHHNRNQKPAMVTVLKVLKKIFLTVHHSHHHDHSHRKVVRNTPIW